MKKLAIMAAALLCCPLVTAQDAATPAATTAPATAASAADAEAAADAVIAAMNELVTVLETIKDKASADAAAVKLGDIKARMESMQAALDGMDSLDEATQQKIGMKLLPAVFMLAPRMEKAAENLEANDCFGSDALKAIMAEENDDEDIDVDDDLTEDCDD